MVAPSLCGTTLVPLNGIEPFIFGGQPEVVKKAMLLIYRPDSRHGENELSSFSDISITLPSSPYGSSIALINIMSRGYIFGDFFDFCLSYLVVV